MLINTINYSFIIPHHNSPQLLNRCLNTIPQRGDIEIIVIDDNSESDKKPQISRPDVSIIDIDAEHTKGAGRARNYGLAKAKGKWLLFADADDFYEMGFVDVLDNYKDSGSDIIFFDAYFNYDIRTNTCKNNKYEIIISNYLKNPDSRYWLKMLKHGNNATWMRMYSHDYIRKIGVKYDEIPACNDGWFVQFSSAMTDKVSAIPQKLYYYVDTAGSITKTRHGKQAELLKQQAGFRINHLLAKQKAYCAIPSFTHGFKNLIDRYGYFYSIYLFLRKVIYDVSPLKLYYYKHFYIYD